MNDLTQLQVHVDGHIAILTLNSPPVNALTRTLNDELTLAGRAAVPHSPLFGKAGHSRPFPSICTFPATTPVLKA